MTLVLTALLCMHIGLNFAGAAFLLLIVVVLLSLLDSLASSVVFTVTAIVILIFLFSEPRNSLLINDTEDIIALAAFLTASLVVTGLIRLVSDLEESKREQALLLDLSSDAIFVRDDRDVITYWNNGAATLYGWDAKDALGKSAHDLLKTTFPVPQDEIKHLLERDGQWAGELLHTRRDGKRISVASRWSKRSDASGRLVGTLESNRDITERKRIEDVARRNQAAYLAEAQKLSHTGSFGWDVTNGEIFWSDETFRIFDTDPTTIPSLDIVLQRTHPEDLAQVRGVLDRAATEGSDFTYEHRLLFPRGLVKHIRVVARRMTDEQDKALFVGAVMDITAQKTAMAELERSEERYRALFYQMPIAFRQLDATRLVQMFKKLRAEGVTDLGRYFDEHPGFLQSCMEALKFQEVNKKAMQAFGGNSEKELIGRSTAQTWSARPDTFRRAMESRFSGEPSFEEETQMVAFDGKVRDVLFTTTRVGSFNNLEISLIGTIDISDRLRAQERLHQLQADFAHAARVSALGELTASIAHEINQPLAAITTNSAVILRWLRQPPPDLAAINEAIESIAADTQRAADIVARVQTLAKRKMPERISLSLDDVIQEALAFLKPEINTRAVKVEHHLSSDTPSVLADRVQLQQVIVNLIINTMQAITQANSETRKIAIRTSRSGASTVRCVVEDSGPGIQPSHLGRLFESFFTTKGDGMGMGLSICRSIIEAHNGRISADNNSTLGGARFSFDLPTATASH